MVVPGAAAGQGATGEALVQADAAGVRDDGLAAVEQVDVPTVLVVLAVVDRVAGDDGELQGLLAPRALADTGDGLAHRVDDLRRQELVAPVGGIGGVRGVVGAPGSA